MPSAYINGFSPITVEDADIHVYDALTYASKTSKTIEIWQGKPDNNGLIKFEVPKPYIGKSIIIICIGTVSGYMSDTLNVTKLGAFHTVKLHGDRGLGLIDSDLSVPNNWYITSQSTIRHIYRNIKYQNYLLTTLFIVLSIASPFIGSYFLGILGLIVGCLISIIILVLGRYATGFSKGF